MGNTLQRFRERLDETLAAEEEARRFQEILRARIEELEKVLADLDAWETMRDPHARDAIAVVVAKHPPLGVVEPAKPHGRGFGA